MKNVNNIEDSCFRCKKKTAKIMLGCFQCIDDNKENKDRFMRIPIETSDKVGCDYHSRKVQA